MVEGDIVALIRTIGGVDLAITDTGCARIMAKLFSPTARYVAGLGWYTWRQTDRGGGFWGEDKGGVEVARLLERVAGLYLKAAGELATTNKTDAERLAKFAFSVLNNGRKNAVLREAERQSEFFHAEYPFDQNADLLNTQTGVVNLLTGELLKAEPSLMCARITNSAYDPTARAERWTRFLREIFGDDPELVSFARRWLGYCATADNREQKYLVAWGTGSNGKSTLFETVLHVLGDYGTTMRPDVITLRRDGGDVPTPALADLVGRRLVVLPEWTRGRAIDEVLVKSIIGGDTVQGRRLYADPFHFKATAKLVIYGNAKPELRGRDWGTWRRVLLLPFTQQFGEDGLPKDENLPRVLLGECDGILTDLVRAAREWHEHGLGVPAQVRAATQAYRDEVDDVQAFVSAHCERVPVGEVKLSVLFEAYTSQWGGELEDSRAFSRALRELGFELVRRKDGRYVKRLSLK